MRTYWKPIGLLIALLALTVGGYAGGGASRAIAQLPAPTTFLSATPSVASGTSVTLVAAGAAHTYVEIQNNTSGNIAISISGASLTGITAGSGNACIVLQPGQEWHSPPNLVPLNGITVYQASGSSTNAITVVMA